jgi:VWFA-related protein
MSSTAPRHGVSLAAGLALLLAVGVAASPQQRPIFSSSAVGVRVDALVTDKTSGRPIGGLTAADFEVRDNGVVQTVSVIDSANVPINAVLAFDMSASTAGQRLDDLKAAGHLLLGGLKPVDRAALTTFNHAVVPLAPLTANFASVGTALDRLAPTGGTAILDGLYVAMMATLSEEGRALVVVCTDGRDTASWLQADEVMESAKRANAVVYVVATGGARRWSVLKDLTDVTGGRLIELASSSALRAEFQKILEDFRSRYILSFTPTGVTEAGFHRIDVRMRKSGMNVKARQGYMGQGGD